MISFLNKFGYITRTVFIKFIVLISFHLLQKEVAFYYFGSKYVTWTVKLPEYSLRPSYRFKSIKHKFPSGITTFIQEDVEGFAASFGVLVPEIDDVRFESVYGSTGNYTNFILVPPMKGVAASKTNDVILLDCGIDVGINPGMTIHPCSDYQEHDYMMSFYKTNDQLLLHYTRIMDGENDERKGSIQSDYNLLLQVKNGSQGHHKTKFHCMGQPFFTDEEEGDYTEDEWVTCLYYSIKDHIPDGINVIPSFQYSRRFNKFQELVSGTQKEKNFLFRAVPDLLFERTGRAVASSLHVGSEVLEVKTNTNTKNSDTRSEFSQVTSSMHSIAIAKLLQQLKNGNKPKDVMRKGLLVFMKKVMYLFTLKASVGSIGMAGLNISRSKIQCQDRDVDSLPLDFVCAGIARLIEEEDAD